MRRPCPLTFPSSYFCVLTSGGLWFVCPPLDQRSTKAPSSNQLQPEAGIPGEWCHLSRHTTAARSNQTINVQAPNEAGWQQEISSETVPVLSNSNCKSVKPVTFGTTALNRVIKISYFSCIKCHKCSKDRVEVHQDSLCGHWLLFWVLKISTSVTLRHISWQINTTALNGMSHKMLKYFLCLQQSHSWWFTEGTPHLNIVWLIYEELERSIFVTFNVLST